MVAYGYGDYRQVPIANSRKSFLDMLLIISRFTCSDIRHLMFHVILHFYSLRPQPLDAFILRVYLRLSYILSLKTYRDRIISYSSVSSYKHVRNQNILASNRVPERLGIPQPFTVFERGSGRRFKIEEEE
jgi:hypothetical protein